MFGYSLVKTRELTELQKEVSLGLSTISELRNVIQSNSSQKNMMEHALDENKKIIQDLEGADADKQFKLDRVVLLVDRLKELWVARKDNPKDGPKNRKANADAIDEVISQLDNI